jgi:deoxyadenosine/deoxycytidine kinase
VYQIEKRGRSYENAIRLDYLKNLNQHYNEWISSYKESKLLIIDMNDKDFVNNPDHFSVIVSKIDVEINGLFS